MAEINKNDIITQEALDQVAFLSKALQDAEKALVKVAATGKTVGVNVKAATSTKQIANETSRLSTAQAELAKIEKQIQAAQAKSTAEYLKKKRALTEINSAQRTSIELGQRDAKTINAQNASIRQLEVALKRNREAYKSLATEQARNSKEGKELKAIIDQQDAAVKKYNSSLGDHRDNVGNYEGALKSMKMELKAARDAMAAIAKTSGTSSQEFIEAAEKAGELKDQINDLNDAIKNTSASKFENLGNSLKDVGSKLINLDFDGAAQSAKQFAAISKTITLTEMLNGLRSLITTLGTVAKAILANPLFILAGVVTGVVIAFKAYFDYQEAQSKRTIERYKREEEAMTHRYDVEIRKQQILGKQTFQLEKQKQRIIADSAQKQIDAIIGITKSAAFKELMSAGLTQAEAEQYYANVLSSLNDEKKKQIEELTLARRDALDEIKLLTLEQAEFERKTAEDSAKQRADDLYELNRFNLEANIEAQKEIADNEELSYTERLLALRRYSDLKKQLAALDRDNAKREENLTVEALLLIEAQYRKKILDGRQELVKEVDKLNADRLEALNKKVSENLSKARSKVNEDLKATRDGLEEALNKPIKTGALDDIQKSIEKVPETATYKMNQFIERLKGQLQMAAELWGNFSDAVGNLVGSLTERRLASIDREERRLDEQTEKELALAGDNEEAKAEIEKRADLRREQLEKKRIAAQRKAAIFEKATAIVQAGIQTALNIVKVFPNVALMALAGALGAIQIAAIAAKPIPQYFKGGVTKGGPIIAGELGQELVTEPGGRQYLTPATATLMAPPAGSVITPHDETMRRLAAGAIARVPERIDYEYGNTELLQEMKAVNANLSRIKPTKHSLIRSGAVVFEAIQDHKGNISIMRGMSLGKWVK